MKFQRYLSEIKSDKSDFSIIKDKRQRAKAEKIYSTLEPNEIMIYYQNYQDKWSGFKSGGINWATETVSRINKSELQDYQKDKSIKIIQTWFPEIKESTEKRKEEKQKLIDAWNKDKIIHPEYGVGKVVNYLEPQDMFVIQFGSVRKSFKVDQVKKWIDRKNLKESVDTQSIEEVKKAYLGRKIQAESLFDAKPTKGSSFIPIWENDIYKIEKILFSTELKTFISILKPIKTKQKYEKSGFHPHVYVSDIERYCKVL